jgi:hypothetical protein
VAWSNIGTWSEDSTYATPDLSAVTQEIVDRGGWASGNALVNYSEDNGSSAVNNTNRIADDFGSGPAPEFDIDYTAGGGGGAARPFLRRRTRRFQRAF